MDFQFTTKELTSFCQDLHDVNEKLKAAQEELARKTILASSSYWSVIQLVGNLMGHLDVLLCFAHLATSASSKYVLPTFQQTNLETIQLTNARHPLLEVQYSLHHAQTKGANGVQSIVPNSVILQKPDSVVQLISGPNMGGKSTYLRQVGLLCLMAQVGCPIPCDCATMNPVDAIFCRVGASDDQKEGISTFYAEMIETAAILKAATRSSLILMDELGRGTSTSEGLALATHVTRYIACRLQCFCIFATHFQELSALEGSVPGIKCFQVDVHVHSNQLQFLFRIRPGHADRSYGIHVAELAQMDPTLIQRAQQIAKSLQDCERHTPRLDNYINALQNALHDVFQHSLSQSLPSSTSLENLKKILTDIDAE
jgi:DNA mismatch repair protein MSH2